jgi:hypothetical protein
MARRSRKEIDYLTYQHTPEKQLEHPSGWCMTDYHEGCKYQFNHGRCGCSCHSKTTSIKKINTKKSISEDSDQDPRPWVKK